VQSGYGDEENTETGLFPHGDEMQFAIADLAVHILAMAMKRCSFSSMYTRHTDRHRNLCNPKP
jgi:hypothetical protein